METILIVARHGNTFNKGDAVLRIGSRTDLPLTLEGREQGRRLGLNLLKNGLKPSRFFSAPLKRALETIGEASATIAKAPKIEIADFLTELDYGEDDGLPEEEVVRRLGRVEARETNSDEDELSLGKKVLQLWDRESILPKGWSFLRPRVERLRNDWQAFATKLKVDAPGSTTLAVTSNGVARFALNILDPEFKRPESVKLAPGSFGVFVQREDKWRLLDWNVR